MIETIKKHKRIVAVVVILILTAVIELICNFPAIRGGYDELDLTKYMTRVCSRTVYIVCSNA